MPCSFGKAALKLTDFLAFTLYTTYIGVRRQQLKQVMRLHLIGRPTFDRYVGQDNQAGMNLLVRRAETILLVCCKALMLSVMIMYKVKRFWRVLKGWGF